MRLSTKLGWIGSFILTAWFVVSTAQAGAIRGLGNNCLDVRGGETADGTPVQIYACHNDANQNWKLTDAGEIQIFGSKCLDVRGGQSVDGSAVQIFQCHSGPNQRWTLAENGEIRGLGNKCLDVRGGETADGTPVQIYACHGGSNQRWQFVRLSLDIAFYVDQVAADEINESGPGNTRDEAYILSRGSLPGGFRSERLPRYPSGDDDYYEFVTRQIARSESLAEWTNQDQAPVGRPVLWAGTLAHNASGEFLVILGEQDNKDAAAIKQVVLFSLGIVGTAASLAGAGPAVATAVDAATGLANNLPENTTDDVIGAFSVRFTNVDGELQVVWLALPDIRIRQGESGSTTMRDTTNPFAEAQLASGRETSVFNLSGTGGGRYRVAATVELNRRPSLTAWEYLGRLGGVHPEEGLVSDRCNRPQQVMVQGRTGPVLITDEPREVRVQSPRFGWLCASDQQSRTCIDGTNLVVAQKGPGDVLRWYCFRERNF